MFFEPSERKRTTYAITDLKFASRQIAKNRGFSVVTVVRLALGIGANGAIFSFVYTILLKPQIPISPSTIEVEA